MGGFGSDDFGLGIFGAETITSSVTGTLLVGSRHGFGTARFGLGRYGLSDAGSTFDLVAVQPIAMSGVTLAFSMALNSNLAIIENPASYVVDNGITVLTATKTGNKTVVLTFSGDFNFNVLYTVTVIGALKSFDNLSLTMSSATFIVGKAVTMVTQARRINKHQYFNPGFGIVPETYEDI